jgi:hypothetical protein
MDIIESYILYNGIGIDIGDDIMYYLIDNNSILPIEKMTTFIIDEFITEDTKVDIYQGSNELVKYNNLLYKKNIVGNHKIIYINFKVLISYILLVNIYSDTGEISNLIIPLNNINLPITCESYDLDNIRLKYELKYNIKKIYNKMKDSNLTIPENIKQNIIIRLKNIENIIDTYHNQQILEKINILKNKFML